MLDMAKVGANDTVYDLGCGDGRLVIAAAKEKGARGVGVDLDPERIRESKRNAAKAKVNDRVRFLQQNLFETDFSEATVLTMYLLPQVNMMLRPKILNDMKPGSRIVSHDFDMEDWQPDAEARVGSSHIYYWVVPANVSGTWDITVQSAEGPNRCSVIIDQTFQRIAGMAASGASQMLLKEARLKGDALEFQIDQKVDGKLVPMKFEGRITGNAMEGTTKPPEKEKSGRPLRWSATRDPASVQPIEGSPAKKLYAGLR
jgi:SAM-dependent methyltransferase